jgi:small conductance mechanosensitive channel
VGCWINDRVQLEHWQETILDFVIRYGFQILGAFIILVIGALIARWVGQVFGKWLDKYRPSNYCLSESSD